MLFHASDMMTLKLRIICVNQGCLKHFNFPPSVERQTFRLVSSSPFYRLLCAFRIYDGTTEIRRWLRGQCEQHRFADRMPADSEVTAAELLELGFAPEAVNGVRRVRDLFERFRDHRNAIAHFLMEGEQGQAHVYLADGVMIRTYSWVLRVS